MVYVRGFIFKTPYNPRNPGFHPWNPLNVQIHLTRNRLRLFLARFSCTQRNALWFEPFETQAMPAPPAVAQVAKARRHHKRHKIKRIFETPH